MSYKILAKKELCPNQYELTIEAPYIVRNAKAGQFIIFRAEENGERVPLTIADVNKDTGALTIVFMAVGYSTKKLAEFEVVDELIDLVGPLGQPTHIKEYGISVYFVCFSEICTKQTTVVRFPVKRKTTFIISLISCLGTVVISKFY